MPIGGVFQNIQHDDAPTCEGPSYPVTRKERSLAPHRGRAVAGSLSRSARREAVI
ncbi:hypothetical protein UCMB321_0136 [Pseudomonas batumici]|uniref:Uncharacterized protein n=1 Tax=Pseudomonas batumici TaxID=226910 RepID=A0A0C2EIA6_9PSED|nr:hypothetical protein UCMB321_0136 [Pseudomonas batumici]